jgi:hypothetical protein
MVLPCFYFSTKKIKKAFHDLSTFLVSKIATTGSHGCTSLLSLPEK